MIVVILCPMFLDLSYDFPNSTNASISLGHRLYAFAHIDINSMRFLSGASASFLFFVIFLLSMMVVSLPDTVFPGGLLFFLCLFSLHSLFGPTHFFCLSHIISSGCYASVCNILYFTSSHLPFNLTLGVGSTRH
jgi:hypothetical protein